MDVCQTDGGVFLHAFLYRSTTAPTRLLGGAVGGSLALQALGMILPPLRRLLGLTPLTLGGWALAGGAAAAPLIVRSLGSPARP